MPYINDIECLGPMMKPYRKRILLALTLNDVIGESSFGISYSPNRMSYKLHNGFLVEIKYNHADSYQLA